MEQKKTNLLNNVRSIMFISSILLPLQLWELSILVIKWHNSPRQIDSTVWRASLSTGGYKPFWIAYSYTFYIIRDMVMNIWTSYFRQSNLAALQNWNLFFSMDYNCGSVHLDTSIYFLNSYFCLKYWWNAKHWKCNVSYNKL